MMFSCCPGKMLLSWKDAVVQINNMMLWLMVAAAVMGHFYIIIILSFMNKMSMIIYW